METLVSSSELCLVLGRREIPIYIFCLQHMSLTYIIICPAPIFSSLERPSCLLRPPVMNPESQQLPSLSLHSYSDLTPVPSLSAGPRGSVASCLTARVPGQELEFLPGAPFHRLLTGFIGCRDGVPTFPELCYRETPRSLIQNA